MVVSKSKCFGEMKKIWGCECAPKKLKIMRDKIQDTAEECITKMTLITVEVEAT